jgi:hypothetical protein
MEPDGTAGSCQPTYGPRDKIKSARAFAGMTERWGRGDSDQLYELRGSLNKPARAVKLTP